jgi:hypothetical protein
MSLAMRLCLLLMFLAMFGDAAMPINVYQEDFSTPMRGRTLRSLERGADSDMPERYPSPLPPRSRRFELAGSIVATGAAAPEPAAAASVLGAKGQTTLQRRSSSSALLFRGPTEQVLLEMDDASDFSSVDV